MNPRRDRDANSESETVFQTLARTLRDEDFAHLYQHPSSCLAIYKALDPFSQYVVRTMLLTTPALPPNGQIPPGQIPPVRWWSGSAIESLRVPKRTTWSVLPLLQLRVLFRSETPGQVQDALGDVSSSSSVGGVSFCLRQPFAHNLRIGLSSAVSEFPPLEGGDQSHEILGVRLESFARRKWEKLLQVIVGCGEEDAVETQDKRLIRLLVREAGLVRSETDDDGDVEDREGVEDEKPLVFQVTSFGFQFLLLDLRAQLSIVVRQFVQLALRILGVAKVKSYAFLFQLGQLKIGCPYPISHLESFQTQLLRDLVPLGLVRRKTVKLSESETARVFYVTPLAREFCTVGASDVVARWNIPGLHGPIIVQTNFHVYAYTDSPIQIALISLFAKMQYNLPNLITAIIDRSSIRAALMNGITADQIISYLWVHAHPKMREQRQRIPVNISNQIRLWEKERNRIVCVCPAMWLDNFRERAQYEAVVRLARQRGWLLWCGISPKLCVVVRIDEECGEENQKEDLRVCVESVPMNVG